MRIPQSEPYELTLEDGSEVILDFSSGDGLSRICLEDETYVDAESIHRKIRDVYDIDQESHIVESDLFARAKRYQRINSRKERISG